MSQKVWRILALPLVLVAVLVPLYVMWRILGTPDEATIVRIGQDYFARYGLITVFICAMIEGLVIVGWYFPGTTIIVLGLMLAAPDIPRVVLVTLLTVAGLLVAYCVNFAFGKYGWYRVFLGIGLKEPLERAQARLARHGLATVFGTYWQFSVASISSTAAGVLQFPFARFLAYSAGGALVWMTFWSTLIYFLGRAALGLVGIPFLVGFIAIWLIVQIVGGIIRRRTTDRSDA